MTGPGRIKVDIAALEDVKCDKCGDTRFEPVYFIKTLPALISPTGKEELVALEPPIFPQTFACYSCGHVNEEFLPPFLKAKKTIETVSADVEPSTSKLISGI